MPNAVLYWAAIIAICLFCGYATINIAYKKGYDGISFFVIGSIFNIAGILWAIGLPETIELRAQQAIDIFSRVESFKREEEQEKEREAAAQREAEERMRAMEETRKSGAEEANDQPTRHLTENRVLCKRCGKLQPIFSDKTCAICGTKVL